MKNKHTLDQSIKDEKLDIKEVLVIDKARQYSPIYVPGRVSMFFDTFTQIDIYGSDISLGGDFGTIGDIRAAISWLVTHLGGTVKWEK